MSQNDTTTFLQPPERHDRSSRQSKDRHISLRGRSHVTLTGDRGVDLARTHRAEDLARNWSPKRKRIVSAVACISTALIGILTGLYAGLVPSIQYYIADLDHHVILGNVVFFIALAVPCLLCWPLPLMHGRKPYILGGLTLAMPLLFPQAIAVSEPRSPSTSSWRWWLLGSRALMGLVLGFASMNFHSILTDVYGASLMSARPHQETVSEDDVRRHGGGPGVWLGIWTWCWMGSLAIGFLLGAVIIDNTNPSLGFYLGIIMISAVLFLNIMAPETRPSPFRRSVAQVRSGTQIWQRIGRGEVKLHRTQSGPKWWGQEAYHGLKLSLEMIRQPGFAILALYSAWIYAQFVLIILLLGSLTSKYYRMRASLRRLVFAMLLPLVGVAYTLSSSGRPTPVVIPVVFAAIFGFLSCLAISECNGLIMETFDCSDLQPGMTGPQSSNYSSFPRVSAGFGAVHSLGYILAAGSTGLGGMLQRNMGQRIATGTMAAILAFLTLLLSSALFRFKQVQIVPKMAEEELRKLAAVQEMCSRRPSSASTEQAARACRDAESLRRALLVGHPTGVHRWVSLLELGAMTRWTEIRRKNRLIDERIKHLNRAALWERTALYYQLANEIGGEGGTRPDKPLPPLPLGVKLEGDTGRRRRGDTGAPDDIELVDMASRAHGSHERLIV
ncbi:uncharacterized protein PgNI_03022 [Pyricularia grisea]|uniref:Major facilitator superfamily (MFS) profile domain-containing protein n=1 Tax=Pyricularia grisea TaxID=148305 RepID=A0A6P8BCA6_PYRGI|nr:uncharacterized protein PgNI_03022 [Pyricularia grisea]TLD13496.1 hypothetical protein PgNI_03022 [Pyricularia grisea]